MGVGQVGQGEWDPTAWRLRVGEDATLSHSFLTSDTISHQQGDGTSLLHVVIEELRILPSCVFFPLFLESLNFFPSKLFNL